MVSASRPDLAHGQIALGPFRMDLAARRLQRNGVDVPLRARAFRVLQLLIQNPGRVVDYQQLTREAWDGVQVSHHTVVVTVAELKDVLGEYGSWITCRARFGYCLERPASEDLIRRGWHFCNQYTRVGFENGLQCFQEAAQDHSADFRAFQAMSSAYILLGAFLIGPPRENYKGFLRAHDRAVALCGPTPELRLDRAYSRYVFELKVAEAEAELVSLERETPGMTDLYVRLSLVQAARGRLDDALVSIRQAQAGDALSVPLAFVWTILRLFRREFEEAVASGKNTVDLHPSSQVGRADYAAALEFTGRLKEALAQYKLASSMAPDLPWIRAREAMCLVKNGEIPEAIQILEQLQENREADYVDAYHLALLLALLRRPDDALDELARAYEEKSWTVLLLDVDPKADALRADPRVAALQRKFLKSS